jgi:cellulose 1,4-beta-cellobiosidase
MRALGVSRLLALFAAIVVVAALWLTVGTAPGSARAETPPPIPPTSPTPPNPSPFPPTVPGDLRVTAVTSTSVTLAWTASAPGCCAVAGYDITWTQAFNDVVSTQVLGNVTTYTFTTIRPATQYNFRVSARDDAGHRSNSSNSVTVITPVTDSGPDTTPPSAPTGLTLGGVTAAGAALSWSGSTDDAGVTGYNVYRFDGLYISTLLATVTGTSYTAQLGPSSFNLFYVRARDAVGNVSLASNTVSAYPTPPTASPSPTPRPPACRVTYAVSSQWAGGFVADVKVTNLTQTAVTGWTLTFPFGGDQRIAAAWNADFRQTGTTVTLTNENWNRVIPAGGSASAGILGRWTTSNAAPTAFVLNGAPCTLA